MGNKRLINLRHRVVRTVVRSVTECHWGRDTKGSEGDETNAWSVFYFGEIKCHVVGHEFWLSFYSTCWNKQLIVNILKCSGLGTIAIAISIYLGQNWESISHAWNYTQWFNLNLELIWLLQDIYSPKTYILDRFALWPSVIVSINNKRGFILVDIYDAKNVYTVARFENIRLKILWRSEICELFGM